MIKKLSISFFLFFFLFLIPPTFYILNYSEAVTFDQNKVIYNLPYPGLLPDHPLYILKAIRDRILEWITRDEIKKAKLYLLFSDKRVATALPLVKKGKAKLAVTTASKAEKYFLKIPSLLQTSTKQGVGPSPEFVNDLKVSNAKHTEVLGSLMKELPQGQTEALNEVLKLNQEIKKQLEKL